MTRHRKSLFKNVGTKQQKDQEALPQLPQPGESMLQIFNVYKVVVCVVGGTGRQKKAKASGHHLHQSTVLFQQHILPYITVK
uniref:Uncharacterized protein n=1 Tax=Glossina palpalis gambiensis TaxID=67801 RepID=A0A1B0BWT8_9MUSC